MTEPIFADIDPSFRANPITGDIGRVIDDRAIKSALLNLLMLDRYERPFQENLYSGVRAELFDLISPITSQSIKSKIENVIARYEPRVEDTEVEVTPKPEENGYDITIKFLPRKDINPTTVSFFLDRVA